MDCEIYFENKFRLVVRPPQDGKTFICITEITKDKTKNVHIVLTMNTLASGMQFFGRMEDTIGSNRIVVFNSNKHTAGNCHHAKSVLDVLDLIRSNNEIKVIICCAHEKRIRNSLPDLFKHAMDSVCFTQENRKFVLHIDEAHKYIPENRNYVRSFNSHTIVTSIIGYSGSPDKIWVSNPDDELFHKIHITDVEKELQLIRSPCYFGVKTCDFHIYDDIVHTELISSINLNTIIPNIVFNRAGMADTNRTEWYGFKFPFDIGNEVLYLSFLKHVIPIMNISQDSFSYNFVPAYTRKVTHYQTAEILLDYFPNANVIVMNGIGIELYRKRANTNTSYRVMTSIQLNQTASNDEKKLLLEPAYVVEKLIKLTSNFPTFVTGLTCVGMSVTLVSERLGNFDNVIMAHEQLNSDKIYQLCRFLFNFTNWSVENTKKIKTTQFYSLSKTVVDTCLHYEEHVELLSSDFAGKSCTLREIDGLEPEEPTERELKKTDLNSININCNQNDKMWKKFKVYDDNDDKMWAEASAFYNSILGKPIKGKSKPEKRSDGFYYCSTTGHTDKHNNNDIKNMDKQSWWSTFQLLPNRLAYARVFVGYDNLNDNSDYTIYIKYACLEDNANTRAILNKYGKKNKKYDDTSSLSSLEIEESDSNSL
jgi:hypothetical protein